MNTESDAETNTYNLSIMQDGEDGEDSVDETSQEEILATSWSELSIIERVGLNSAEMSEKAVETEDIRKMKHLQALSHGKEYTLKQRLQAEEHARNLAEENIQLELTRGRETLETLKGLCLDSKRSKILQTLELSLDILGGTVERISNTAEVLGAVHQEARSSRAVELMVAHVENLRRRHDKNVAELEEAKKMVQQQQSTCRNIINPRASPEPQESDNRGRGPKQNSFRRRISASIISAQTQEKRKRDSKKCGCSSKKSSTPCPPPSPSSESSCSAMTKDDSYSVDDRPLDPDEPPSEDSAAQKPPEPSPVPDPECPPPKQVTTRKTQSKSSSADGLQQRHKGKAALPKKAKEKKTESIKRQRRMCGSTWRQLPLTHWLYHCRWALLCTYLFVLFCVTYFLWKLHNEAFEP